MNDLTFNNPLKRSLTSKDGDGKRNTVETARLLIGHLFNENSKNPWS